MFFFLRFDNSYPLFPDPIYPVQVFVNIVKAKTKDQYAKNDDAVPYLLHKDESIIHVE